MYIYIYIYRQIDRESEREDRLIVDGDAVRGESGLQLRHPHPLDLPTIQDMSHPATNKEEAEAEEEEEQSKE